MVLVLGYSLAFTLQYAFVALPIDLMEVFRAALGTAYVNFEEYGFVLETGRGEPTPDTIVRIAQEYGIPAEEILSIDTTTSA